MTTHAPVPASAIADALRNLRLEHPTRDAAVHAKRVLLDRIQQGNDCLTCSPIPGPAVPLTDALHPHPRTRGRIAAERMGWQAPP